jgi:putative addiction module killer protein
MPMLLIETTSRFDKWHARLDRAAAARIAARLLEVSMGIWGDHKQLGGGLIELREHFGAGLRIYATHKGRQVIIILAGGSKHGQQADIDEARKMIQQLKG